ncbi:MAG: hypothetical protein ACRETN_14585 [Nevskiales bacterium]
MGRTVARRVLAGVVCVLGAAALAACKNSSDSDFNTVGNPTPRASSGNPPAPTEGACATQLDASRFGSADELWAHHVFLDSLKARPTASPSHQAFVDWLDARLAEIPGLQRRSTEYEIQRWLERDFALAAGPAGALTAIWSSGSVPYSKQTSAGGVTAALVYVPVGQAISSVDVAGKIILREAATGTVPRAAFAALEWWSYDPELTLITGIAEDYERDFLAYEQRITDLREAGSGDAAGLILMHGFPHEQVKGHYAPYEGELWPVPALYVGVDEGERLKQVAQAGGQARIRLSADEGPTPTRTLIATLPGVSAERIVIESHTDGTNVHEDNGPLVMLEMAKYFAAFPKHCHPKTLEFVFPTAHFHQKIFPPLRHGGAGEYARQLNRDYEDGTVAMALVLEHLGTLGYDARPRASGAPGRELVPNGTPEAMSAFVNESPVLIATLLQSVIAHDMRGFIALRGADLPGAHIPLHRSFGGEGTPYSDHLIPTVAYITAPWPLYNPAFGLEVLDKDLLYRQTLMFTDYVQLISPLSRLLLGGALIPQREARAALCGSPAGDLFICAGTPAEPAGGP